MSKETFPFLSLPGEVRNMIYHYTLVAQDNVHILDMHPHQYETTKSSAKRFRQAYKTAKSICPIKAGFGCPCKGAKQCVCPPYRYRSIPDFFDTIYTRDADHNSDLSPALLRTNKEIREEALAIFYRENTFFFLSMSAVMPFLRDRTPESLASIKSIGFHLPIDYCIDRISVFLNWVCAFPDVSCMAGLELQNLSLKIEGRRYGPSAGGWWGTRGLDWVHSITRIRGLQGLHIEFDLGSTENPSHGELERVLGAESANAHWLWCLLAPGMLADRKEAVEKAAAYLKSDEAAREKDRLFVLNGQKGREMVWELRKAMRQGGYDYESWFYYINRLMRQKGVWRHPRIIRWN